MKAPCLLPAIAFISSMPVAGAGEEEMWLRFENGDALKGRLTGVEGPTLTWDAPILKREHGFHTHLIREIETPPSASLNLPEGNHIASITLTNGDRLKGCLTRVTDDEIGLRTSFAGDLIFRRDMVEELYIEDRPELIYVGPTGLEGWIQSQEEGWSYRSASLVCDKSSSIGREIGRHERIRVSFDVDWRDNSRLRLFLHADSKDPEQMANGYELVCQSQYAYLRKRVGADADTVGSSGGIREFTEQRKLRFEILQDLTTGRFRLSIDGRVIDDWIEGAPSPEKMGAFLHFSADQGNGTRISRIMVTDWDGLIDGEWGENVAGGNRMFQLGGLMEPEEEEPEEEEPEPGIRLRNGDRVEGEIVEIREGVVRLKTVFNEFELPVNRLRSFALRTAEEAADPELRWEPIRRRGDVRAHFSDGGHVTFQLTALEDGRLVGASQTFGSGRFDLGAFSRIEFNLYPPPIPAN